MKKIILASVFATALSFAFTGCLKDKGFDNYEYGINDPDTQPPGVGFPFGSKAKNDVGVDVTGSNQAIDDLVYVNLESGSPAASDVNVTISNNTTALLNAYNTANGTSIQALPTALWNVATSITIPGGGRNAQVPLNVTSTLSLDPNIQYAVGLTITAADGGYKVADNLKNLFIVFGVKNAYDGKYNLKGRFHHPVGANPPASFSTTVEMHTSGPNSVRMYWPLAGAYASPISYGGSLNYFGSQEPRFTVDGSNAVVVDNSFPSAPTSYTMGQGFDNAGYNHRWDPVTKTFYACWGYNLGAGGTFGGNGSAARLWIDTLIRTGPR